MMNYFSTTLFTIGIYVRVAACKYLPSNLATSSRIPAVRPLWKYSAYVQRLAAPPGASSSSGWISCLSGESNKGVIGHTGPNFQSFWFVLAPKRLILKQKRDMFPLRYFRRQEQESISVQQTEEVQNGARINHVGQNGQNDCGGCSSGQP